MDKPDYTSALVAAKFELSQVLHELDKLVRIVGTLKGIDGERDYLIAQHRAAADRLQKIVDDLGKLT